MLTISRYIDCAAADFALLPASPEQVLFFDIETTGFSPASSSLYLIGALAMEQGRLKLTQWFATRMSEEQEVLLAFKEYLSHYSCLVHFNGDQFDIPYLEKCAGAYGITLPFSNCQSVDILKQVRQHKKLLGLSNCRQKTVEQFLSIHREDMYDGGQLIPVYQQYLGNHATELLDLLLLHNAEDVTGMLQLLPILSYGKIVENLDDITLECWKQEENKLYLTLKSPFEVPVSIDFTRDNFTIRISKCFVTIEIPLFLGELKYYYPDYKEYYYLPEEDIAIHQKIAEFVAKEHKKKATRATAYTKKRGIFIKLPSIAAKQSPIFQEQELPCLKTHWKEKERFVILEEKEELLQFWGQYMAKALLK